MANILIRIDPKLHARCRERINSLCKAGRKTTWDSLIEKLLEGWLSGDAVPDTVPKPAERKHLPGCGVGGRGCLPACPFFDPRFDG